MLIKYLASALGGYPIRQLSDKTISRGNSRSDRLLRIGFKHSPGDLGKVVAAAGVSCITAIGNKVAIQPTECPSQTYRQVRRQSSFQVQRGTLNLLAER